MRLEDKLYNYSLIGRYPFHMPGHKRQEFIKNQGIEKLLNELHKLDITEISDFDNLHNPEGVILELENEMSDFYHTKKTYPLVNGSTSGVISAICACTKIGDEILVARNCHKSVINACTLRNLKPVFISPEWIEECGLYGGITPENVDKLLKLNPNIKAVFLVSPTYEGIVSDICGISKVVKERGIPLIVDEAHGAHFPFRNNTGFPKSAIEYADIVIQSLHKTLPCMTQTALLHVNGDIVNIKVLEHFLQTFQSSSPSYIMMADISHCFHNMSNNIEETEKYYDNVKALREELEKIDFFRLLFKKDIGKYGIFDYDIGKLTIITNARYVSGKRLFNILRDEYNIELEMSSLSYCIAMTSVFDSEDGFKLLLEAFKDIKEKYNFKPYEKDFYPRLKEAKRMLLPGEAFYMDSEAVSLKEAVGRVSKESIYIYPPGCSFLIPGEVIDEAVVKNINDLLNEGFEIVGMPKKGFVTVVK